MRGCVSSRLVANLHAAANLKFALCLPALLSTQSGVGFMNFSRRRFIGAIAACSAGTMAPRGFAEVQLGVKPALLPRAMASLESHWSQSSTEMSSEWSTLAWLRTNHVSILSIYRKVWFWRRISSRMDEALIQQTMAGSNAFRTTLDPMRRAAAVSSPAIPMGESMGGRAD